MYFKVPPKNGQHKENRGGQFESLYDSQHCCCVGVISKKSYQSFWHRGSVLLALGFWYISQSVARFLLKHIMNDHEWPSSPLLLFLFSLTFFLPSESTTIMYIGHLAREMTKCKWAKWQCGPTFTHLPYDNFIVITSVSQRLHQQISSSSSVVPINNHSEAWNPWVAMVIWRAMFMVHPQKLMEPDIRGVCFL